MGAHYLEPRGYEYPFLHAERCGRRASMPAPSSRRRRAALASTVWSIATHTGPLRREGAATSGGASHPGCGGGGRDEKGEGPSFPVPRRVEVTVTHHRDRGAAAREQPHQGAPAALQHHPAGRPRAIRGSTSRSRPPFPASSFTGGSRRAPGRYFGPFSSAGAVRQTIALIHKLFRVRQCTDAFFRNRSRPCLSVPDRPMQRGRAWDSSSGPATPRMSAMQPCSSRDGARP